MSAEGTVTAVPGSAPFGQTPFGHGEFGGGGAGPTLELVLDGGEVAGTSTSGGSAGGQYIGVPVALGAVTSSAAPLIVTHFAAVAASVASGGTATAVISVTAVGTVTSSAVAPAAAYGDPFAWDTSTGTATANRTFTGVAATATITSSGSVTPALGLPARATGTVSSTGFLVAPVLHAQATASASVTSAGAADGARVQPASVDAQASTTGVVGAVLARVVAAAGAVASSSAITDTAQMWVLAAVTVETRGETDTNRFVRATLTASGSAAATRGHPATATATVIASGHAAGGRLFPAAVAVSDFSFGVAGGVIAWQQAAPGTVTVTATVTATAFTPALRVPAGPVKPQVPVPRQRLLVVDTVTGRLATELPYSSLSWTAPLNDETSCTASLVVEAALDAMYAQGAPDPRLELSNILTGPFRYSLVVCYGNVAVQGGPLLPTDDEDDALVSVGGAGMERMLARRLLLRRQPGNTDPLAYASRDVIFENTNTKNAIALIVAEAMADYEVPRGLPIFCSEPPDPVGTETFYNYAYDASTAWKAITDIVQRPWPNGPDVRLEPMLAEDDDGLYVWWDLHIGDPTFGTAPGNYGTSGPLPWTWDDTVARVTRSVDSAGMATDTISQGNGSERGVLMCESTDDTLVNLGFPALETLESGGSSIKTLALLQARADAAEAAHKQPTDTWTVNAPIDGEPPLGTFRRGDVAKLEIRRKLLIPPGNYLRRITGLAGNSSDPSTVALSCAYEDPLGTVLPDLPGYTY